MVRGNVQARAGATNVLGVIGCNKVVCSVALSRNEISALAFTRLAVDSAVVRPLCEVVRGGAGVVGIEGAVLSATRTIGVSLLALREDSTVHARLGGDPRKSKGALGKGQGDDGLGEHTDAVYGCEEGSRGEWIGVVGDVDDLGEGGRDGQLYMQDDHGEDFEAVATRMGSICERCIMTSATTVQVAREYEGAEKRVVVDRDKTDLGRCVSITKCPAKRARRGCQRGGSGSTNGPSVIGRSPFRPTR